uniref:RNA polymerase Rpb6 n=1 Tax=viral metagenome TaxID=1070528 RepID=A0A6C0CZD5_9ZZZZ
MSELFEEDIVNTTDDENNEETETIVLDDKDHFDTTTHFTQPILTKYEKTMIIIERTQQLLNQALPLINNPEKYTDIDDIVEEELKQKKIPFIIRRSIGNKHDYYKLSDLEIL